MKLAVRGSAIHQMVLNGKLVYATQKNSYNLELCAHSCIKIELSSIDGDQNQEQDKEY